MPLNREPVAIAGFIRAAVLCAVGFGLDWSAEQVAGLMLAAEGFLSLVVRQKVTPVEESYGGDVGSVEPGSLALGIITGVGLALAWVALFTERL